MRPCLQAAAELLEEWLSACCGCLGGEERIYIHLTGKALTWQGRDEAGHFPAPGSLLLRDRLEQQGTREEAKE